jgi:DNA-binding CsgD family transcriptional regulator
VGAHLEVDAGPGDDAAAVAAAAVRWLALDRDVVIRGTDGSGRSRVLDSLLRESSRQGMTSVLVRAAGALPLAALRAQPSAVAERVPATAPALGAWLTAELQGRRTLLLLDDLDQFDQASAEIVLQAVRATGSAVVATTTVDLAGHAEGAVADLVAERAPAELRLAPLGFEAMSRLLAAALRAPADVALTSSITARSGGNPRAALALADAARFAGAVRLVDGRWRKTGSLDDVPVDAVAHALLARLDAEQVDALELLAWTGPLSRDRAEQVLGPAVLDDLAERGRLRQVPTGAVDTVSVDPPALASAMRARLSHDRRRQLAARVEVELGAVAVPFQADGGDVATLLDRPGEVYWQWAADLTGLVHEHATAEEAARRALWQTRPTVAHANAYLGLLLRRRADAQVGAVLAGTERAASDTADDLIAFRLYELRWDAWRGAPLDHRAQRLAIPAEQRDAVAQLLLTRQAELPDLQDRAPAPGGSQVLRQWQTVMRTARLLELGHAELAISVCNQEDPTHAPGELDHLLEGLHGEALILLGRREEAGRRSEMLLVRAFQELDLLGIRVHACLLAQTKVLDGDDDSAWRVLSTSLRLGPGGPLDNTFFRRSLAIGAVIEAHRGATDVARMLLDELDGTPHGFQPLIHSLGALGRAALADARGESTAGEALWQAGERYLARGLDQPALVCWLAHPHPLDPARLARLRATYARCPVPLLEPYLRLHEALATGDQDGIVSALGSATVDVAGLVRTAVAALDAEHVGHEAVCALDPRMRPTPEDAHREALSSREREVAALASAGSTNRQIADALGLSVRTVENHVSNALRKLGVTSRAELLRWFPSSAGARS